MKKAEARSQIKKRRYNRGLWAEYLATIYLFLKGYKILKNRYKTPVGEIDIIARKKHVIVFVEVKTRKTIEDGLHAITSRSMQRITRAAQYFEMKHYEMANSHDTGPDKQFIKARFNPYGQSARFDVIIWAGWRIRHIQNAWDVNL